MRKKWTTRNNSFITATMDMISDIQYLWCWCHYLFLLIIYKKKKKQPSDLYVKE